MPVFLMSYEIDKSDDLPLLLLPFTGDSKIKKRKKN